MRLFFVFFGALLSSCVVAVDVEFRRAVESSVVGSSTVDATRDQLLLDAGGKWKNYFKVNDEVKLLPEVMSKLDFSTKDHAHKGDARGQRELAEKSHWGRLYVDGWPGAIQYLRGHFGEPLPFLRGRPVVIADPWDACEALDFVSDLPLVIFAGRGNCTFGTKAKNVAQSNATRTLVIVNNEPGAIHAPGPDAHDVPVSIVMIPQSDGEHFAKQLEKTSWEATFVAVNCVEHSETRLNSNQLCEIVTDQDEHFVKNIFTDGGRLILNSMEFEYLLANFGTAVLSKEEQHVIVAHPEHACSPLVLENNGPALLEHANAAILVSRGGGCSFLDKVIRAQNAGKIFYDFLYSYLGATAVIVANANPEDPLLRASCHPRWQGHQIDIPVVLVSKQARDAIVLNKKVTLVPSQGGHELAWERLAALAADDKTPPKHLIADWPDRASWLTALRHPSTSSFQSSSSVSQEAAAQEL